jgi:hypothetical protein
MHIKKMALFILFSIVSLYNLAQSNADEKDNTSTFTIAVDCTNSIFSLNNLGLNSISNVKKFIVTPYINYEHKSGFGITIQAFLSNDGLIQSAITPSYSYSNDAIDFNVSFAKTFVKDYSNPFINIIQNDFSTYITSTKKWLQPGLSINIGKGKYVENYTTTTKIIKKLFMPVRDTIITITTLDTAKNTISNVNASMYVQHIFNWDAVFHSNDAFSFTPTFMVNLGNQKLISKTTSLLYLPRLKKKINANASTVEKEKFALQSIGIDLNATYKINQFFIQPQIYIDQYVAASGYKPQTYFTLGIGYNW